MGAVWRHHKIRLYRKDYNFKKILSFKKSLCYLTSCRFRAEHGDDLEDRSLERRCSKLAITFWKPPEGLHWNYVTSPALFNKLLKYEFVANGVCTRHCFGQYVQTAFCHYSYDLIDFVSRIRLVCVNAAWIHDTEWCFDWRSVRPMNYIETHLPSPNVVMHSCVRACVRTRERGNEKMLTFQIY